MPENRKTHSLKVVSEVMPWLSWKHGRGQLVTLFVPDELVSEEHGYEYLRMSALNFAFLLDSALNPASIVKPAKWTMRASAGKSRLSAKAETLGDAIQQLTIRAAGSTASDQSAISGGA